MTPTPTKPPDTKGSGHPGLRGGCWHTGAVVGAAYLRESRPLNPGYGFGFRTSLPVGKTPR